MLKSPPRDLKDSILGRRDCGRLAREAAMPSAGMLSSYAYSLMRYGMGPRASTQAFLTPLVGRLLHAYSCRSERITLFNAAERPSNPYLNGAVGGSMALQVIATLTSGIQGLRAPRRVDALAAAGAALPLLVNETTKVAGQSVSDPQKKPACEH